MVVTLLSLVMKHDSAIRLFDREHNRVLEFSEENLITQCLRAAKLEWDAERVPGQPHPTGKGFKEIGWDLLWALALKVLEETAIKGGAMMESERKHVEDTLKLLRGALPAVQRFCPTLLEPHTTKVAAAEPGGMDTEEHSKSAQVWVLKVEAGQQGDKIHQALLALQSEGILQHRMDCQYRQDRAPAGSLARVLGEALSKSNKSSSSSSSSSE